MRLPANGADVSCTFQRSTGPGDSACAITYRCAECHIETAEAQVRFDLSGRFAFAHQITWEASVAWSRRQPIDGRSSLRASIRPPPDALLRGARPSEVTTSGNLGKSRLISPALPRGDNLGSSRAISGNLGSSRVISGHLAHEPKVR